MAFFIEEYIIALDSKARLVLPLEIRDYLGIGKKEKLLLSASAADGGKVTLSIAKAPEFSETELRLCSKNGAYVLRKGVTK